MRAKSVEITLTQGMDAMAEYAMTTNPNLVARLALNPGAKAEFYATASSSRSCARLSPSGRRGWPPPRRSTWR